MRSKRVQLGIYTVFLLGFSACTVAPNKESLPEAQAQVWVENHTDWRWQVAFDSMPSVKGNAIGGSSTGPWLTVEPRARCEVRLAGGTYRVRSGIVRSEHEPAQNNEADASGQIELAAGHSYTWPLATLFSREEAYP